jgi:antitoxin component YwqK of YwqJK toxin-antitoxin module
MDMAPELKAKYGLWENREEVARKLDKATDISLLYYDPYDGLYYINESPYTGYSTTLNTDGSLDSVTEFKDGREDGISVAWFANGQIERYAETQSGFFHGFLIQWNEDGVINSVEKFINGVSAEE